MVWIVGMFFGITFVSSNFAEAQIEIDGEMMSIDEAFDTLASFKIVNWLDIWGPIKLPVPNTKFFSIILKMATWDFPFMTGYAEWIRTFVFIPLSAAIAFGFFIMFISAIFGLFKR